ncbi:MAG: isoleucine--tRNA ligase, partial [Bacteroidales bacterium]|nr:isoleucine--tRNA ligase [Bacteroidales bacterium]
TLGKKYGKQMKEIAGFFAQMDQKTISDIERAGDYTLSLPSGPVALAQEDYTVSSEDMEGWLVASEGQLTVALDVTITDQLRREGVARELVNRIQNLRKDSGFDVTDRINVTIEDLPEVADSLESFADYLKDQTLARKVSLAKDFGGNKVEWEDGSQIEIKVEKIA